MGGPMGMRPPMGMMGGGMGPPGMPFGPGMGADEEPPPLAHECPPGTVRLVSATLWIGSIPRGLPREEIEKMCQPYGWKDIKYMEQKQQAFVIVESRQAAEAAVERLDGLEMADTHLRVNFAKGFIQ